jgi:hypothetical protein
MQHSPSREANQFAASQEIPYILWNMKVNYSTYKGPPPVSILCQLNSVHIPIYYEGGPKRNRNRSLVGGPVVVHASAARSLLRGPFCISLPTGIIV